MIFSTSADVLRSPVEVRVAGGGLTERPEGITIFSSAMLRELLASRRWSAAYTVKVPEASSDSMGSQRCPSFVELVKKWE